MRSPKRLFTGPKRRVGAAVLGALSAAALMGALAPSALGDYFGYNAGYPQTTDNHGNSFANMAKWGGATTVRIAVGCTDATDWNSAYTKGLRVLYSSGVRPLILYIPCRASNSVWNDVDSNGVPYVEDAIIMAYCHGGGTDSNGNWNGSCTAPDPNWAVGVEIGNEANSKAPAQGYWNPTDYGNYYWGARYLARNWWPAYLNASTPFITSGASPLHSGDLDNYATCGANYGPGTTGSDSYMCPALWAQNVITAVRNDGNGNPDAIGMHLYGSNCHNNGCPAAPNGGNVGAIESDMESEWSQVDVYVVAAAGGHLPVWTTEFGTWTCNNNFRPDATAPDPPYGEDCPNLNNAHQGDVLTIVRGWLHGKAASSAAYVYELRDTGTDASPASKAGNGQPPWIPLRGVIFDTGAGGNAKGTTNGAYCRLATATVGSNWLTQRSQYGC